MKGLWKEICVAAFMGLILPALLLNTIVALDQKEQVPEESIETSQPEMVTETPQIMVPSPTILPNGSRSSSVTLFL